ncbi:hypothetical protein PCE1_001611 [Barthelona sp. PCE]
MNFAPSYEDVSTPEFDVTPVQLVKQNIPAQSILRTGKEGSPTHTNIVLTNRRINFKKGEAIRTLQYSPSPLKLGNFNDSKRPMTSAEIRHATHVKHDRLLQPAKCDVPLVFIASTHKRSMRATYSRNVSRTTHNRPKVQMKTPREIRNQDDVFQTTKKPTLLRRLFGN